MELNKPYFMENEDWFYHDSGEFRYKLTEIAPPRARESYKRFYNLLEAHTEKDLTEYGEEYEKMNILTMKDLVDENNEILRKEAEEVSLPLSNEDLELLKAMSAFVMESQTKEKDANGDLYVPAVGLSAPQIGISKKMFVIAMPDDEGNVFTMNVVNPKIVESSKNLLSLKGGESCLSVKSVKAGRVLRAEKIRVKCHFVNLSTGEIERKKSTPLLGYLGVIFQHEYDHLNGVLFTDIMEEEIKGEDNIEENISNK